MQVVISGYGRMGHMVEQVLLERGIECAGRTEDVASFPAEVAAESVCIDFTTPEAFRANYRVLAERFRAVVVGTTGWSDIADDVRDCFKECDTTLVYASNFSIGVNVMFALADLAARKLSGAGYKASIVETHHVHKLDAPSGTARSLADIVSASADVEVPIESRRIGEVPGIHELTFESDCDRIVLTHEAYSRKGFAQGAVQAAVLAWDIKGIYEFKELILK